MPPFAIAELNNHGSLFATRPKLNDYVGTRKDLLEGADTLFAAVINGKLHVLVPGAWEADLERRDAVDDSHWRLLPVISSGISAQPPARDRSCSASNSAPRPW